MINYLIDGQSLKIVNKVAAGGTYNYIEAEAIFSEEWDGLDKKLHFKQGEASHIAPMSNDKVDETAGLNLGAGTWETWVSGIKSEEKSIANLNTLTWTLKETTYWTTELKALDLLTAANYTEDTLANVKAGTTANTMALSEGVLYIYNNNTETSPSGALTYSALKQRITTQRQLINVYAADDGTDEGSGFPEFSVTEAERIIAMAQAAYNAKITSASATVDSNVGTPAVNVVLGGSEGARSLTFAFTNMKGETGEEGEKGEIGDTGVGISSITLKESTASGNTYTVTLTDSSTYDFTAPKGPAGNDGEDGEDGVSPGITIAEITGGHSVTITDAEHPGGQTFNVMDGDASDFDELANRPKYNGSTMTHSTNIPEVKSAEWNAKYEKPATGIPSTDMSSAVQTSLDKADSALQEHQSLAAYRTAAAQDVVDAGKYEKPATGIPSSDMAAAVQTSLGKADTALQEHQSLADYSTTAQMNDAIAAHHDSTKQNVIDSEHKLSAANVSGLADVATTGSYNDLSNKPTIPTVPTKLSDFTDDLGSSPTHTHSQYLTEHQSLSAYRTASAQDTIDAAKVPTSRKVNGHALTGDVTIADTDIAHGQTTVGEALDTASTEIANIEQKIPSAASSSNQLADKSYVGTQISGKENTSNKVTEITMYATNTQYASAKAVFDLENIDVVYEASLVNCTGYCRLYLTKNFIFVGLDITATTYSNYWRNVATYSIPYSSLKELPGYPLVCMNGQAGIFQLFDNDGVLTARINFVEINPGDIIRGNCMYIRDNWA